MFKDYEDIRNWLENFIPLVYGKEELGLLRIKNLLKKLGNPEKKFKSIHVAGTSGKGSTSFYIARLLEFSRWDLESSKGRSLKIGLHISPHLVDIRERMQIFSSPSVIPAKAGIHKSKKQILDQVENDNTLVPMKRFIALVNEIKPSIDAIGVSQPELLPSYFEILVALSFLYFEKEKVDIAVVEVGLGGRLDATNVLTPEISVITNIGLDHTELLGNTVEKIAKEKAGIIKSKGKGKREKGVPVVTAATGKALKVIEKVAKTKKAPLINIYTQGIEKLQKIDTFSSIAKPIDIDRYIPNYVNRECAQLAIMTVLELNRTRCFPESSKGGSLSFDVLKKAFSEKFPGRFEEIESGVVIDGAHNTDKIRSLIEFIRKFQISNFKFQIVLVVAFKKGKNWQEMIDLLVKNLPIKKIIATEYFATTDMGKGSAVDPVEIKEYVISNFKFLISNVEVINNSQEAVFEAINLCHSGKRSASRIRSWTSQDDKALVLVTGSLYLVGEARTLWYTPDF